MGDSMEDSAKKSREQLKTTEMSIADVAGMPEDVFGMLHKYGTYNIQPTADSDNEFPEIAQGIPPEKTHREVDPRLNEPMGYQRYDGRINKKGKK